MLQKGKKRWWQRAGTLTVVAALLAVPAGCGGSGSEESGTTSTPEASVAAIEVDAPLRELTYVAGQNVVFAYRQNEPRVVKIDATPGGAGDPPQATTLSEEMEEVGENLETTREEPNNLYVPQPRQIQFAIVGTADMLLTRTVRTAQNTVRVAVDPLGPPDGTGRAIFALSQSGQTVTGVNLETYEIFARLQVRGSENTLIESPLQGDAGQFWLAGPEGVAYYAGSPPERQARRGSLSATALAPDTENPDRAYIGSDDQVVAVESRDGNIETVAQTDVGAPIEYLITEGEDLYAATNSEVVVLDPENLEVRRTVNFDDALEQEALRNAAVSGLAVTEDSVYLSLAGEPYLIGFQKT